MATRNFVPRADGEGKLGTPSKKWGDVYATTIHGVLDGNASSATLATNATNDADGNPILSTYVKKDSDYLGYRQPSTAYAVGAMAYHVAIPTGWYLECTTAGTTGSGTLTITSPTVGGTVSDGTVTWTIGKDLGSVTGEFYGDRIVRDRDSSLLILCGGKTTQKGGFIKLYGQSSGSAGMAEMSAAGYDNNNNLKVATLRIEKNGSLYLKPTASQNDTAYSLDKSAVVAESLGTNGYRKYASGLIEQWGRADVTGSKVITFPITFSTDISPVVSVQITDNPSDFTTYATSGRGASSFKVTASNPSGDRTVVWRAIGY